MNKASKYLLASYAVTTSSSMSPANTFGFSHPSRQNHRLLSTYMFRSLLLTFSHFRKRYSNLLSDNILPTADGHGCFHFIRAHQKLASRSWERLHYGCFQFVTESSQSCTMSEERWTCLYSMGISHLPAPPASPSPATPEQAAPCCPVCPPQQWRILFHKTSERISF